MTFRPDREQLDRVRDRFTRTADPFAQFVLTSRAQEAERLADMAFVGLSGTERAVVLDVACGPGTFTRAFAARARFVLGLDLTPAMLEHARQATSRAGLANVAFACADASTLPCADATLQIAVCGYCFHHFLDPARVVREIARVLAPGGRIAVEDIIVPDGADADLNNRIERARDPSHVCTLTLPQLHNLLEDAGLRVRTTEVVGRPRSFDHWMRVGGSAPGTAVYEETRRLMEDSMAGDTAGFRPRFLSSPAESPSPTRRELEYAQTTAFVVAEKL